MNILFVEPDYYTRYPPLGLMKLISYHRSRADNIKLIRGTPIDVDFNPDIIKITSLFTYAWKPVHRAIEYYHNLFPEADIYVGGIYASIMPGRLLARYPYVKIHHGLYEEAERYLPAYDILSDVEKWKDWNTSILFTSRGCIRSCPFCVVPQLEGPIRSTVDEIWSHIHPDHKKVILWDNNFLASPDWKRIIKELIENGYQVDFNQGLDARLMNEENVNLLADVKMSIIRMAYDWEGEKEAIHNAVSLLSDAGIRTRNIFMYALYNFYDPKPNHGDDPDSFLSRVKEILDLGCVSYPMRFEPLDSLEKNSYISPLWTEPQLELIAKARRVIGYGGSFPPYKGLIEKINDATSFEEAFSLYAPKNN